MKSSYYLSHFVRSVLDDYSSNYPNKVVNPSQLTCFIVEKKYGRTYYYPVQSISSRDEIRYRLDAPDYYEHMADFNIDRDSYCQNPIGIQTLVTGASIIRFEQRGHSIDSKCWRCPQLGVKLHSISSYDEEYKDILPLLKEGILLFRTTER